jgi:NADH:ubiquinone oxidoreductase subunit 5 (subunit L)/multisubunit Na+/H+ antiporter MnhA subunit
MVMTLPLVVLASLTVVGGALDLPWAHHSSIAGFIAPTVGYVAPVAGASTTLQWTLGAVDFAVALIGIAAAFTLWRGRSEVPALEPSFFERVWRWDDFYDATIGRPLTSAAAFAYDVVETKVVDGAVSAVATRAVASSHGTRKVQTGLVRHYGLAMLLALSVLVVFSVARAW